MLQALIHRKLDRWLGDHPPEEIEDLLTSVVLGSASYAPDLALLPFLCDAVSLVGERLASKLDGLQVRSVQFWPQLAGGSVPDVLVELCNTAGHRQLLVVEVKLGAGKSSDPSDSGPVTDQLGKYWLSLRHEAVQHTVFCPRGRVPDSQHRDAAGRPRSDAARTADKSRAGGTALLALLAAVR